MRKVACAAAAIALAAGPAAAAPKGVAKPPATMDAKGVDAWIRENIAADGWTLLHADGQAVSYGGGPNGLKVGEDGVLKVDIRREYYKAVRLGPMPSRSNLQTWEVDCGLRRVRVSAMSFYSLNNLRGTGFRKAADDPDWTTVAEESQSTPVFDRICASAPVGKAAQ